MVARSKNFDINIMAYKGIQTSNNRLSTRRAPPQSPETSIHYEPSIPDVDSYEFPATYLHPSSTIHPAEAPQALLPLDSQLDRLIEVAAAELGCSHEELGLMKQFATQHPDDTRAFCQHIFDHRILPQRIKVAPLLIPRVGEPCVFSLETIHGTSTFSAPRSKAIDIYSGHKIEMYSVEKSPFVQLLKKINPLIFDL
jgi:hypothetical protein